MTKKSRVSLVLYSLGKHTRDFFFQWITRKKMMEPFEQANF
jgi:hypothetical protein